MYELAEGTGGTAIELKDDQFCSPKRSITVSKYFQTHQNFQKRSKNTPKRSEILLNVLNLSKGSKTLTNAPNFEK